MNESIIGTAGVRCFGDKCWFGHIESWDTDVKRMLRLELPEKKLWRKS